MINRKLPRTACHCVLSVCGYFPRRRQSIFKELYSHMVRALLCFVVFWHRSILSYLTAWWRHQMVTFSALLTLCVGNSPVTGEFPSQRPVTQSFDVFFDLCLSKRWVNNQDAGDLRCHHAHYDFAAIGWFHRHGSTCEVSLTITVKIYRMHICVFHISC